MKLRTLDDMPQMCGCRGEPTIHIDKDELKQEAIKWIKELRKEYITEDGDVWIWKGMELSPTVNWIAHFFNISEKDLEVAKPQ